MRKKTRKSILPTFIHNTTRRVVPSHWLLINFPFSKRFTILMRFEWAKLWRKLSVGEKKSFAVYIIFPPTAFSFDSSGLSINLSWAKAASVNYLNSIVWIVPRFKTPNEMCVFVVCQLMTENRNNIIRVECFCGGRWCDFAKNHARVEWDMACVEMVNYDVAGRPWIAHDA